MRFFFGIQEITRRLCRIETKLARMEQNIMAQIDDLKAAIAAEDADIDAILAMVASETAQIADLQTQLAAAIAAGANPTDLTAQIADIQAKTAAMAAVLPAPAPAPAPAP